MPGLIPFYQGLAAGQQMVDGLFDQQARKQAGAAVQAGDYDKAVGLLTSRGLSQEAGVIAENAARTQTARLAAKQAIARQGYGAAAVGSPVASVSPPAGISTPPVAPAAPTQNAPNYRAAANAAVAGGDLDYAKSMTELADKADAGQREHLKALNEQLGQAAVMLGKVKPEDYDGAFEHLKPMFSAMQLPDDKIAELKEQARDPATRQAFLVQAQGVDGYLKRQDDLDKAAADAADKAAGRTETHRHNVADEGVSAGNLGVARASLAERTRSDQVSQGIAAGHLALARDAAKSGAAGGGKVTEAQAKDGFNAKRMIGAEATISGLENAGYDASVASKLGLGDHARSYAAAQGEWADSLLRMTTGAAATKQEVESVGRTYFPQPGDSAVVRKAKAAARQRVMGDAMTRAGPAAGAAPAVRRFNPATGRIE